MKTLVLGKGYVGSALINSLDDVTYTNRKKTHPGSIPFDLESSTTWKNIKEPEKVIWTFPAAPVEKVEQFYEERLKDCENLIVLASTSRYIVKRQKEKISEESEIDRKILRVQGEEFLRSKGATVLALAGIYGPGRDPKSWLYKRLIRNPEKFVNLIHLDDIIYTIKFLLDSPQKGECINLADGAAKSWREIGDKCGFHFRMKGERELSKIISNEKIKDLLPKNFIFKDLYTSWE